MFETGYRLMRLYGFQGVLGSVIVSLLVAHGAWGQANQADEGKTVKVRRAPSTLPAWARNARWYYVEVARFANGSRENDPPGTRAWDFDWPAESDSADSLDERAYGGDLQGVIARLPDIKALGCNVIALSPVFTSSDPRGLYPTDVRHVADTIGVRGAIESAKRENMDRKSWVWTKSDQVLLDLIKKAHELEMKVVVDVLLAEVGHEHPGVLDAIKNDTESPAWLWFNHDQIRALRTDGGKTKTHVAYQPLAEGETYHPVVAKFLFDVTQRWMDPNGDGDASDGVDGWRVLRAGRGATEFWTRWREHAKKINPRVLLALDKEEPVWSWLSSDRFDCVYSQDVAARIAEFLTSPSDRGGVREFMLDLEQLARRHQTDTRVKTVNMVGGAKYGRLASQVRGDEKVEASDSTAASAKKDKASSLAARKAAEDRLARWRLVAAIHGFFPGAPMLYYGEEIGMTGGRGAGSRAPAWRVASAGSDPPSGYRADYRALVKTIHSLHQTHEPLRRGEYRTVLADEEQRVFAFSRALPGNELIVVVNASDERQKVQMEVGRPGTIIGVLRPELKPYMSKSARTASDPAAPLIDEPTLRIAGHQCMVSPAGEISFHLEPMSLKILLNRE